MKVFNRITRLFSVGAPARSRPTASFLPALEALEDRLLMSASGRITSVADADGIINYQYAIRRGTLEEATTRFVVTTDGWTSPWSDVHVFPVTSAWQKHYGPQLVQISAGRDHSGNAECFAIATDRSVWVWGERWGEHPGWHNLGFQALQISGSYNDQVYAVGTGNGIYMHNQTYGWFEVPNATSAGPGHAFQVSAGQATPTGRDVLWVIDMANHTWSFDTTRGWLNWGGWVTQISATVHGNIYVIGGYGKIYTLGSSGNWVDTLGAGSQISAGTDATGRYDRLFQIGVGSDHSIYEYSRYGPQAGWTWDGGFAWQIAGCDWARGAGSVMLIGREGAAWWHSFSTGPSGNLWNYEGGYWLQ